MKECNTFLWYYYDKRGREIDAILKELKGFCGAEVKYRQDTDERSVRRIAPLKKCFLLSKVGFRNNISQKFLVVLFIKSPSYGAIAQVPSSKASSIADQLPFLYLLHLLEDFAPHPGCFSWQNVKVV